WTQGASLDARRSTLGACVLDGLIYAVGGFDGTLGLQSAEVYDPTTRTWRNIAPMSTRRSSVAVVALDGLLFAVGGYDGGNRQCQSPVECQSPTTDTLPPIAAMALRRNGASVAVHDRKLCVIGAHDGPAVRQTVECDDPVSQISSQCVNLSVARRNA